MCLATLLTRWCATGSTVRGASFPAQQLRCTDDGVSMTVDLSAQALVLAYAHGLLVYIGFDKLLIDTANVCLAVPYEQNSMLVNCQYHLCLLMMLTCWCATAFASC